MPSYLHNRPAGSGDAPPRPHHHSQYNNSGVTQTSPDAFHNVAQQSMGQQRPTAPAQGSGSSTNAPFIPAPAGFTYQTPTFQCARCQEEFGTRVDLDRHSIGCGAAALLTGYLTPYPVAQTGASQPHGQSPHGAGGFQTQNKRRGA